MTAPAAFALDRFRRALGPVDRLALAISGGPDSVAMLLLAHDALPGRIAAATVDHGLRPEAAAEAAFVAGLCADRGIPHAILHATVAETGDGLQAAARTARYALLGHWCRAQDIAHLATAHHADDQAETLLMRLARGAGLAGLSGIRAARPLAEGVTLIRPLLGFTKAELTAIVAGAGIVAVDDPSNRALRYDRTHARALLADGRIDARRLAASAATLAEAEAALDWAAQAEWARRARIADDAIALDPHGLPAELMRRLVLRALAALGTVEPRGPALIRFIAQLGAGGIATLGGVRGEGGTAWRFTRAAPHRTP